MKLALTLPLNPDETLYSYASRLAQLNGSNYAQDFAADMGVNWSSIKQGQPEAIATLNEVAGIPTKRLIKATHFSVDQRWFTFRGQKYHRVSQTRRRLKVCPTCLKEELTIDRFTPYRRAQWELAQCNACTKHKQLLITFPQAPLPRDPLDFSGYLRERESDLRSEVDHPTEVKMTDFSSYLENRYLGYQTDHWLDQFDLDVAAQFAQNLGILYLHGAAFQSNKLDRKLAHEAGEVGFSVCNGGEEAIIQCLSECKEKSVHPKGGYLRDFGFFYLWVARRPRHGRMKAIRDLFREFIFDNYPVAKGEVIFEEPCPKRRIHTWATAAVEHGLQYTRAYALRDAIAKPEHQISFPADTYTRELRALEQDVTACEAAQYLNVSDFTFDQMEKAGLVKPRLSLPKMRDAYNYEDLDDFLAKLKCNAKLLPENADGLAPINRYPRVNPWFLWLRHSLRSQSQLLTELS